MDYPMVLIQENDRLADLFLGADLDLPVQTCPGWSLRQLLKHVGRGHRWAAQIVRERAREPRDPREVPIGRPPDDPTGAIAWLRAGAALVCEDVAGAPDAVVWTFTGLRPASWWIRRRLHEATVHRADTALALGTAYEIEPKVAADGIEEMLQRLTATASTGPGSAPLEPGVELAMATTDTGQAWLARGTTTGLAITPGPGPGPRDTDATLVGPAAELLLALTRRRDLASPLEVRGDPSVVTGWLGRTPY